MLSSSISFLWILQTPRNAIANQKHMVGYYIPWGHGKNAWHLNVKTGRICASSQYFTSSHMIQQRYTWKFKMECTYSLVSLSDWHFMAGLPASNSQVLEDMEDVTAICNGMYTYTVYSTWGQGYTSLHLHILRMPHWYRTLHKKHEESIWVQNLFPCPYQCISENQCFHLTPRITSWDTNTWNGSKAIKMETHIMRYNAWNYQWQPNQIWFVIT